MSDNTDKPPIRAQGDPSAHHKGTYLRKNARNLVLLSLSLIALVVLVVVLSKGASQADPQSAEQAAPVNKSRSSVGSDGKIPLDLMPDTATQSIAASSIAAKQPEEKDLTPEEPLRVTPRAPQLDLFAAEKVRAAIQLEQFRQQQYLAALGSDTTVNIKQDLMSASSVPQTQSGRLQQAQAGINDAQLRQSSLSTAQDAPLGVDSDPNGQAQKLAFLGAMRSDDYLPHTRETPISRFELNVGTIIPATLISGINSDMPGQIIAQVSQNVYDSATGRYLLLPQGAKLYGVYDSKIAYGQDRVLTAWTRINYPDGTKLNIAGMGGMDTEGYSGFNDQVDNHYWKTFGNAMLLGLISGTAQAGISADSKNGDTTSAIADGVTQQFAQTGSSLIQKNLDVQPTIKIRGGYKFNIMINKDIVLTPYTVHQ